MKQKNIKLQNQAIGIEGIITSRVFEPKTKRDFALIDILRHSKLKSDDDLIMQRLISSCMVQQVIDKNIVTTSGLTQITKGLSTNLTALSELEINYTAVGSGTTTPTASDTTLTTETFRNVVNSLNYSNGVLYASMSIDFTEDSGTYYEGGLFINGTATADSGLMFDHVLLNAPTGITKSTSQVLTISYQITFSPV